MKKSLSVLLLAWALVLTACARQASAPTWQEQYDLGVRYLNEGNYQEAIIAFTAAIGIDPKQDLAYAGLADAHIALGDYESAEQALRDGIAACGETDALTERLNRIAARSSAFGGGADGGGSAGAEPQRVYNEYGGEVFETRSGFRPFEELDEVWQQIIPAAANAAIANDRDALFALLNDGTGTIGSGYYGYTVWNGCKVFFNGGGPATIDSNGESLVASFEIELRPQVEQGYYCYVYISKLAEKPTNDSWLDYVYNVIWYTAPCTDWQWNGAFKGESWEHILWRNLEDSTIETYEIRTESGDITNGLRTGTTNITTTIQHITNDSFSAKNEQANNTFHHLIEYADGKEISRDDNTLISSSITTIDSRWRGVSLSEQWVLDKIYW